MGRMNIDAVESMSWLCVCSVLRWSGAAESESVVSSVSRVFSWLYALDVELCLWCLTRDSCRVTL